MLKILCLLLVLACSAAYCKSPVLYPPGHARTAAPAASRLAKALGAARWSALPGEAEGGYGVFVLGLGDTAPSEVPERSVLFTPYGIYPSSESYFDEAADYYIQEYLTDGESHCPGSEVVSIRGIRLALRREGSPCKTSYSDFNPEFTEEQLLSFDTADIEGEAFSNCEVSVDTRFQREGKGALRMDIGGEKNTLRNVMWRSGAAFHLNVEDKQRTTLKLWVYIEDTDFFATDHDAIYGRQTDQATLFFRIIDAEGRYHAWNHTLMGSGWHEVELSFAQNNGYYADLNYHDLVGFGLLLDADPGTVVELDSLRAVKYRTVHKPSRLPLPARLISDCEYDSYDGCIVSEWYGGYFSMGDSLFGRSSYAIRTHSDNGDFRQYVGCNTGLRLDYYNDELVLWMKVNDLNALERLFIELNEDQDRFEYEKSFTLEELQTYGLTAPNEWRRVALPLTDMWAGCPEERKDEKYRMPLNAVRFYASARDHRLLVMKLDKIYVTDKRRPDPVTPPRK